MDDQDSSELDCLDVRNTSAEPPHGVDMYEERPQLVVARPLPFQRTIRRTELHQLSRLPIRRSTTWSAVVNFRGASIDATLCGLGSNRNLTFLANRNT